MRIQNGSLGPAPRPPVTAIDHANERLQREQRGSREKISDYASAEYDEAVDSDNKHSQVTYDVAAESIDRRHRASLLCTFM